MQNRKKKTSGKRKPASRARRKKEAPTTPEDLAAADDEFFAELAARMSPVDRELMRAARKAVSSERAASSFSKNSQALTRLLQKYDAATEEPTGEPEVVEIIWDERALDDASPSVCPHCGKRIK